METKIVTAAIKTLREHIGRTGEKGETLSQSEFGLKYLGITLPTQQRYERHGPPIEQLVVLAKVADDHGRKDLSSVFKSAAIQTVPPEVRRWLSQPPANASKSKQGGR